MLIRDKVLAQMLELYVPSMPDPHGTSVQSFVNQFADNVLEALVMKNDVRFLA